MSKQITNRNYNSKGELHGYNQWIYGDGKCMIRGMYKHNQRIGYLEFHNVKQTRFYIK